MYFSDHIPVLLTEVVSILKPKNGHCYVDATFGAGGYSIALLEAADCFVWGIDRDPVVKHYANEVKKRYPDRFRFCIGCFGSIQKLLADRNVHQVDGIALDLGVSSIQLANSIRGFSFKNDGPLDMRMGVSKVSASDIVNNMEEKELADIIFGYGEERSSRKIAKAIAKFRKKTPITRTAQLADVIKQVTQVKRVGHHPATKTFQALRIYVNDEINQLSNALANAEFLLKPGGRLAVVSFHSLEDRCVKNFLIDRSGMSANPSRHLPGSVSKVGVNTFTLAKKRVIKPSLAEIENNPRARSARLRWGERTNNDNFKSLI